MGGLARTGFKGEGNVTFRVMEHEMSWVQLCYQILQTRVQDVGELDASYVLKPLGYRLQDTPCLVVLRTEDKNILQYVLGQPTLTNFDKLTLVGNPSVLNVALLAHVGDPIELLEAARCIAHLHSQDPPIAHGGIHPTQILVGNQRRPRLFDFGIVSTIAALDPPPSQATVTPSNPRGGYYAPELLERGTATPHTDVYAFAGVMLSVRIYLVPFNVRLNSCTIKVMTGSHPHNTHPVPEVAWLSGKPSPSEYPALQEKHPLWALMNQMWEREGSARPNIYQVVSIVSLFLRSVSSAMSGSNLEVTLHFS